MSRNANERKVASSATRAVVGVLFVPLAAVTWVAGSHGGACVLVAVAGYLLIEERPVRVWSGQSDARGIISRLMILGGVIGFVLVFAFLLATTLNE